MNIIMAAVEKLMEFNKQDSSKSKPKTTRAIVGERRRVLIKKELIKERRKISN